MANSASQTTGSWSPDSASEAVPPWLDADGDPQPAASPPAAPDRFILAKMRDVGKLRPEARLREVPLLRAPDLDARADPTGSTRVWLALEALQVTGSVHVRGAVVALAIGTNASEGPRRRSARGARHVVASGSGNQGVAIAYAASVFRLSSTVVVPRTVSRAKRDKIERYGAHLVVAPTASRDDAHRLARTIASRVRASLVPGPGDDSQPLGNGASLGFEIVRALGAPPHRVIVPSCDDGLLSGLMWALSEEGAPFPERAICAVQRAAPAGDREGDSVQAPLAEELAPSRRQSQTGDSTGGPRLAVEERRVAEAIAYAYRDLGLVIEGTAAAALAPVLDGLPEPLRGGDVVVVLTGRNIDPQRLREVLAETRA